MSSDNNGSAIISNGSSDSKRVKDDNDSSKSNLEFTSNKNVAEIRGLYPPGCICYDLPITPTIAHNINIFRKQNLF